MAKGAKVNLPVPGESRWIQDRLPCRAGSAISLSSYMLRAGAVTTFASDTEVEPRRIVFGLFGVEILFLLAHMAGEALFIPQLDLGFAYNTQNYHGSYGTTIAQNISQRKNSYGGSLTYNIPKTASSIGVLLGSQRYTDGVLPTFNFSQNREDLNFTIRF